MSDYLAQIHKTIRKAYNAGLNPWPVRGDGSKRPVGGGWKELQSRRPKLADVLAAATRTTGIGLLTGATFNQENEVVPDVHLEAIDFDNAEIAEGYGAAAIADPEIAPIFEKVYKERTPTGGFHMLYTSPIGERNQKLASRKDESGKTKTLIETRGEAGYIVIASSGGSVHPSGKAYEAVEGSDIGDTPHLTELERAKLIDLARSFNEPPEKKEPRQQRRHRERKEEKQKSRANGATRFLIVRPITGCFLEKTSIVAGAGPTS